VGDGPLVLLNRSRLGAAAASSRVEPLARQPEASRGWRALSALPLRPAADRRGARSIRRAAGTRCRPSAQKDVIGRPPRGKKKIEARAFLGHGIPPPWEIMTLRAAKRLSGRISAARSAK